MPTVEKFMPLPLDDVRKKKNAKLHPWSEKSEEELKVLFGD